MSSLSPDQVAFVRLCHIIVDHVPKFLRNIFLDKFNFQMKKQWGTADGKWFLKNEKFKSKLNSKQKQLIEAGDINKWDMTILSHALLYSSHFLLISSPPLQGLQISQNSKSEITSSGCPDLSQSVKKGDTLYIYSGSNISKVEVDTVSQSVIKIINNQQINWKGCFEARVCSDHWYLIKKLSDLRNTKYAHCEAAAITESELSQVMEEVKNVYEKFNRQDCIQSLQHILQEPIIEPSEIKRYQEEWKKIYDGLEEIHKQLDGIQSSGFKIQEGVLDVKSTTDGIQSTVDKTQLDMSEVKLTTNKIQSSVARIESKVEVIDTSQSKEQLKVGNNILEICPEIAINSIRKNRKEMLHADNNIDTDQLVCQLDSDLVISTELYEEMVVKINECSNAKSLEHLLIKLRPLIEKNGKLFIDFLKSLHNCNYNPIASTLLTTYNTLIKDEKRDFCPLHLTNTGDIAYSSATSKHHFVPTKDVMSEEIPSKHSKLIAALKFYMNDLDISGVNFESVITLIKSRIENHVKTSLEDGIAYDEVSKQIHDFITDALIPADIFGWCQEMLKDCKKVTECSEEAAVGPKTPPDDVPPLFCKDVVYHASICCNAICNLSKDQTLSLQTMFSGQGHTFEHVSLSSDRLLLIAQKDDVMYFCFGGNYVAGKLNNYARRKDAGYRKVFPQRYLTELLRQGKRLVFTGFSFSCMIACSIITNLWDSPLNTAKTLLDNATCILFGPLAERNKLQMAPVQLLLKTIHAFYIKDDVVLKLTNTPFFENMVHMDSKIELVKLWLSKRICLEDHLPVYHHDDLLYGCCSYLISQDNQSLYWKKLDDVGRELFRITEDYINKLSDYNLSQHQMENYLVLVQRGYLEKEVPYSFPEKANAISDIHALKPKLERVEVHCQEHPDGRELTLIFIGDNMWFSREFQVSFDDSKQPLRICIDSENVSQKQIQYCHGEIADAITDKSVTHCRVKVKSTFFQIFTANVLLLFKNPDPISFRQSQLAKQNPSEIIKLSFLSALLELSPYSQGSSRPSERFMLIVGFLQQAARIVPLESILFAIASCSSHETMIRFVQACAHHFINIPCSKVMQIGYKKARDRILSGNITQSSQYDLVEEVSHLHWQDNIMYHPHYDYEDDEYLQATDIRVGQQYQYNDLAATQVQQQYQYNDLVATQVQQQYQYNPFLATQQYPLTVTAYGQDQQPFFRPMIRTGTRPQKPSPRMFKSKGISQITQSMLINTFLSVANNSRCERPRKLICGQNIGEIYPVDFSLHPEPCETPLKSLPQILHDARKKLTNLSFAHNDKRGLGDILSPNGEMLQLVNDIIENDLEPCVSMLGGFMEQQIRIPLVNNPKDTAEAFVSAETSGAVGVWALFALGRSDIESILCGSQRSQTFVVQIAQFIQGVLNEAVKPRHIHHPVSSYDGKLQFLLQGLTDTVSCSSHYISYTLERELVQLCDNFKITPKSKVDELTSNWDMKFKETALALVPNSHRPIVARWIIWALNIHQLREGLAKYISIGVIGLVNSGKSTLVKMLFKKEAVSGTYQSARTTIPFIYNMDDSVEGLGVIDFPGVDDRDESIKGLAKLLVGLAQIVVFVCSYEKFHTASAKEWTSVFHNELSSTPILICLTHADKLCEESKDNVKLLTADEIKETKLQDMTRKFHLELKEIVKNDLPSNCTAKFCTLSQNDYSPLNSEKGRKNMRKIGIFMPKDIGDWIIEAIETHLKQSDLAHRLSSFFDKQD